MAFVLENPNILQLYYISYFNDYVTKYLVSP